MSGPGAVRGLITNLLKLVSAVASIVGGGLILRGYGRWTNPEYLQFLNSYRTVKTSPLKSEEEIKKWKEDVIRKFDFDFNEWPVEYRWIDSPRSDVKKPPTAASRRGLSDQENKNGRPYTIDSLKMLPCDVVSYVAVHTFGRRMMYPGSLAMLQRAMDSMLLDGRVRMIERFAAERFKLETFEGNHIDSIVIDRRNSSNPNGKKLVICCEGNAGFYEVGIMCTPIDAGYSVLGWNHPGFAGSTGLPFPDQVVSAADTVIKFANEKLGFKTEDIVVFAWSIGGYPSSWLSQQYPDIHGLILDATFDDVVPLAISKMPSSWKPLVVNTIRNHLNLNISDNLSYYNGPVLVIRRLKDEIIHTIESDPVRTNRANDLLVKLMQKRFPHLLNEEAAMTTLRHYLSGDPDHQKQILRQNAVDDDICSATLISYIQSKNQFSYPLDIGSPEEKMSEELKTQLVLFIASKHLVDFDSTHCTPLPRSFFNMPWNLFKEAGLSPSSSGEDYLHKL